MTLYAVNYYSYLLVLVVVVLALDVYPRVPPSYPPALLPALLPVLPPIPRTPTTRVQCM